ncbi:hypothetical protein B0H19DRAFT_370913 [Mycena capillaripes]|nr:hypothetical protein B0H19DRAFT_370913 [Mycena capillaripes]
MMLRSIILQLSAQSPNPYAALNLLYEGCKGQTLPTHQNLVDVLEKLLSEIGRAYIVLDALDECKDNGLLLRLISRLRGWTKSQLHILFTSQPREIFTTAFEGVMLVSLQFSITQSDIRLFVSSELRSNLDLEHLAQRAAEVTAKVVQKSNGMFRLAACLLDELSRQKLDTDIDAILANLPSDLFGIYSRFLEPIHQNDLIHVTRVLRWLLYAKRPLTLLELKDALAFNFSDPLQFVFDASKRRSNQAEGVCKMLQGLVTVGTVRRRQRRRSPVVALAHSSVADYLVSDEFLHKHGCDLGSAPSHTFLAKTCVGLILCLHKEKCPLLAYAALFWNYHLRCCDDGGASTIRQSGRIRSTRDPTRLVLYVMMGYTRLQFLFENDTKVSRAGGFHELLDIAFAEAHTEINRMLLENGAEFNTVGEMYGIALQAASAKGHTDIVHLLLEHSAEVDLADGRYGSALQAASAQLERAIKRGYANFVCFLVNGTEITALTKTIKKYPKRTKFSSAFVVAQRL